MSKHSRLADEAAEFAAQDASRARLHEVLDRLEEQVTNLTYPMPAWPYPNDLVRDKGFKDAKHEFLKLIREARQA
jgi:uncharacterized membrane-anchored protein YjiN (DUF445 family)